MGSGGAEQTSLHGFIAWKWHVQATIQTNIQSKIALRIDGDRRSHIRFTLGQRMEEFRLVLRDRDDGVPFAFCYGGTANVTEAIFALEHRKRE
jgi:hypothetical protein